VTENNL